MKQIKVILYLEFYHFLGGLLFKNIGTGLLSSYRNQQIILKHLGIPFVEKWEPDADILQINTPWLKSLWLMKKAHRRGMKVIVWSHVTMEDAMQVFRFMPYVAPLFRRYLKYAYNSADMIFSPSAYTKSLLVAYGISPHKIVVQSNAVNLERFYPDAGARKAGREKYGLKGLVVGTVGLVIPRKGVDTFLRLAHAFPQNEFLWFGKIYSSLLVKSLPPNLPKNTRFTGHVDSVNEAYNSLDIFIFPSYEENQGMVVLEAAAVGLPILVRDILVYQGWLRHGENCLKAKTEEEFDTYLKQLLEDGELRERLGNAAKILAKEESVETLAKKALGEYQKLLGG